MNWSNLDAGKCTFVQMQGDNFGRCNMIIENETERIFFEYGGQIVGELSETLRMSWGNGISQRIKNLVRGNINLLKKGLLTF